MQHPSQQPKNPGMFPHLPPARLTTHHNLTLRLKNYHMEIPLTRVPHLDVIKLPSSKLSNHFFYRLRLAYSLRAMQVKVPIGRVFNIQEMNVWALSEDVEDHVQLPRLRFDFKLARGFEDVNFSEGFAGINALLLTPSTSGLWMVWVGSVVSVPLTW